MTTMNVIISDPNREWAMEVKSALDEKSMPAELSKDGKDCQLKVYKKSYQAIILDVDTENHNSMEVLKYVKLNHPYMKVIMTATSQIKIDELGMSQKLLKKLGVHEVLLKPFQMKKLITSLQGDLEHTQWKLITEVESSGVTEEIYAKDEEFCEIKLGEFYSGNHAIFDFYIKLSPGKFVKILNRGEKLDHERISSYAEKKTEYLYFKNKDRGSYVNFINEVLSEANKNSSRPTEEKVKLTKSVSDKFIEEIYTNGLKPQIVEEGKKLCQNMYDLIHRDKALSTVLKQYQDYDPPAECHLFLTTFFSILICKNLDWTTKRTVDIVSFGSFLHDIGMMKLPKEIASLEFKDMSDEQQFLYKKHPLLGVELLSRFPIITEPVKQIVYQHHELVDGEGFPNGLNGLRIYPMAKIVSLANAFTDMLMEEKITPIKGLERIVADETFIKKYDAQAIRSLFMGFIKEKSK